MEKREILLITCICNAILLNSPDLKAQVSFSDRLLSIIHPSVCLLNIYIFDFFFRASGPILTRLGKKHPWAKGIQNFTNEGQPPSPRVDDSKRVEIHRKLFKIFICKTSRAISIQLCTNHP
jgi:hypothetical protein